MSNPFSGVDRMRKGGEVGPGGGGRRGVTGRETTEKCVDTQLELYVSRKEENKVGKKNRLHGDAGGGGCFLEREILFFPPFWTFYLKHKLIKTFLVSRCQNVDTPTNRTVFSSVNGLVTYL